MPRQIGHITIDTIGAERSKFTAPLVLVHGLWCTSNVWHRLMGYLAHRGWDCHALNLRGRTPASAPAPETRLHDYLEDLNQVIRAFDSPPVLIGHDLGALLVLAAELAPARAAVALAPLLPAALRQTPIPALTGPRARLMMVLRGALPPPARAARTAYFGDVSPHPLVDEPKSIADELADPRAVFRLGLNAPTLIVAGEHDRVTPLPTIDRLAHTVGAELLEVAGAGHGLPWDRGWEERATEIHRWLVRTLGDALLVLLNEEDLE